MVYGLLITIALTGVTAQNKTTIQTSVGLEDMAQLLRGDVRLISIGDSYSAPYFSRIAPAGLRVWPIPRIEALCNGADSTNSLIRCIAKCEPVSNVMASDSSGYSVEREESESTYFGLPVLGLGEIYTDENFSTANNGSLFEFKLNVNELDSGVHGVFSSSDNVLEFRLLYRSPSNYLSQPDSIFVETNQSLLTLFSPIDDARKFYHLGQDPDGLGRKAVAKQINASVFDISLQYDKTNVYKVQLLEDTPLQGTRRYFDVAGAMYMKTNADGSPYNGLYFTSIGDGSWSYAGYGSDAESSWSHDKTFSLNQFTHWLDVTTIRRNQPVVFLWLFDVEPLNSSLMRSRTESYIDQADAAANLVGIQSIRHLLVTPHMLNITGEEGLDHDHMLNHQTVCAEIAAERENVSSASIYAATDGILFDGSAESIAWLQTNGFTQFRFGLNEINLAKQYGGNLLDPVKIHPNSKDAAAFFAAILGDIIRNAGCPADLNPNGVIGIDDLLEIIRGWGQSGESDLNEDGDTDISDILIVIDSWGDCWPVQAPFNTPAFRCNTPRPIIRPTVGRR